MVYFNNTIQKRLTLTCIAVVRQENKMFMAGDRGASDENSMLTLKAPKVWKTGQYLIGYAGTMDGERIRLNFKPPVPDGNLDRFMYTKFLISLRDFYDRWWVDVSKDSDFGMIICVKGRMFEHSAVDMSLTEYDLDYLAMGSASEFALGSLYSTQKQKNGRNRVIQAVGAAINFSTSCTGPIDTVSI
jgi:ATP-dependent protease HslVU (ClpYQ) peptidase subunit